MPTLEDDDIRQDDDPSVDGAWNTHIGDYDFAKGEEDLANKNSGGYDEDNPASKAEDSDQLKKAEAGENEAVGIKKAALPGEEAALNYTGKPVAGAAPTAGAETGATPAASPAKKVPRGFRGQLVAASKKGRGAGVIGVVFTVIFILLALGSSSLDTEHYKSNFITKANAAANRVLQKRRSKNILKAVQRTQDKLKGIAEGTVSAEEQAVADAAKADLEGKGFTFNQAETGEIKTIDFKDSTGKTGTLDLGASDFGSELDRFATEGGPNFADEFITAIEPDNVLLGESFRGPAATSWMENFHISLNEKILENSDPNKTPDENLKAAMEDEAKAAGEKPVVDGGTALNDPNKDAQGKPASPEGVIAEAQKQSADSLNSLTNATPETVAASETAAQQATDVVEAAGGDIGKVVEAEGPTLLKDATEVEGKGLLEGPLIVGQQACKVDGAIQVVNNTRRYAYAAELIGFGFTWLAFADARKAGYSSGKANALMELWMHRPNTKTGQVFGTGGAFSNAIGDKTVHASSANLTKYSVGFAAAGILASITKLLRPYATACKVVNNTWLNIGIGIVGITTLVFAPEVNLASAIASAVPLLTIVVAQDIVTKLATPILVRTGAHLVMSGIEPGDALEAAVTSGVVGGMNGINNAHGLTPTTNPVQAALNYDAQQYQKRQLARASFYDRYINPDKEDSLVGHMAITVATAVQNIQVFGFTKFFTGVATTTQTKLARSVFPSSYAATTPQSLCPDPQVLKLNVAADDFCNVSNASAPDLDISRTQKLLFDANEITSTGAPSSDSFKKFIEQCASGAPGLLYENNVKSDGSSDGSTDLCVDNTSNPLPGENVTVADAYNMKDLAQPKLAWWQKAIGSPAYAAADSPNSGKTIGRNVRYAAWLGYINDVEETKQTLTGDFSNNPTGSSVTSTSTTPSAPLDPITGCPTAPVTDTTQLVTVVGTDGHSGLVHKCIADHANAMFAAAKQAGILLGISSGWRSPDEQRAIRVQRCAPELVDADVTCGNPQVAPWTGPNTSRHLWGTAMDLTSNDGTGSATGQGAICYPNDAAACAASGNKAYAWLVANAATFGFKGITTEGWHWSADGK